MKRLLFAVATVAVLLSAFLLWENYNFRKNNAVMAFGLQSQQAEIDSLKREIDWQLWADTVDGGVIARGHY